MKRAHKYKCEEEAIRKMISAGVESAQQDVDALGAMITHVEEMMGHVSDQMTREEIEELLITSIDLWDAPF